MLSVIKMCCNLTVVIDCACTKRVLEIFERINVCDCVKNVLFQKLEMSFCKLCEGHLNITDQVVSIIKHFALEDKEAQPYYYEEPLVCTEKIFR